MSSGSVDITSKPRKRACEACKARKVRCNGEQRCQQCSHSGLQCTYQVTSARSRTYARGKTIRAWRAPKNEQPAIIAPSVGFTNSQDGMSMLDTDTGICSAAIHKSASTVKGTSLVNESLVIGYLPDYEEFVYPFHPIVSPAEARIAVTEAASNIEARAFSYALAAVTINLTRSDSIFEHVSPWIEATMKLQQPMLKMEQITVRQIITTQWCHVCLMGMKRHDLAYYYLRQSLTMLQLLRVDEEQQSQTLTTSERARRQRLYHMLFIHERFLALTHQRSILLSPLPQLAIIDTSIPPSVDHGFRQITGLFVHVDEDFLFKWNRSDKEEHIITPAWIEAKHQAIESESISAFDEDMGLSEFQLADLIITKHWLHMLLWQIAVSQCLLSSSSDEQFMTLLFPIRISAHLRNMLTTVPKTMFTIHGTAMHSKLFEIADTIGNVLITVPALTAEIRAGRIADFLFLLHFLSSLPRWDAKQHGVLESKLVTLREMFPHEV